jgi:hypothetical protein
MNRGFVRLGVVATASFVAAFATLDTVATAGLVSAPRRRVLDVSLAEERKAIHPRIVRNSALLALAITGFAATVLTVRT